MTSTEKSALTIASTAASTAASAAPCSVAYARGCISVNRSSSRLAKLRYWSTTFDTWLTDSDSSVAVASSSSSGRGTAGVKLT